MRPNEHERMVIYFQFKRARDLEGNLQWRCSRVLPACLLVEGVVWEVLLVQPRHVMAIHFVDGMQCRHGVSVLEQMNAYGGT